MEIKGKVLQVLPIASGMGKNGEWHRQPFVIETGDKYPKKVYMDLWGKDLIDKYDLVEGMMVTAFIELDSREFSGKWYTNVKAWKIQWDEQKRPDFPKKEVKEQEWPEQEQTGSKWSTDDLPF